MSDPMIRLTGLWQNEMRSGEKYLAGSLGAARLVILPNSNRRSDSDPSHVLYVSESKRRDDGQQRSSNSARGSAPQSADTTRFEIQPGELDPQDGDSVPF